MNEKKNNFVKRILLLASGFFIVDFCPLAYQMPEDKKPSGMSRVKKLK